MNTLSVVFLHAPGVRRDARERMAVSFHRFADIFPPRTLRKIIQWAWSGVAMFKAPPSANVYGRGSANVNTRLGFSTRIFPI